MRRVWPVLFALGIIVQAASGEEILLRQDAAVSAWAGGSPQTSWFSVEATAGKRLVVRAASVDFTPTITVQVGALAPIVRQGRAGSAAASVVPDAASTVRIGIAPAGDTVLPPGTFSIRVSQVDPEPALAPGDSRRGELSYDDATTDDGRYYDTYELPVSAGDRIAVAMVADDNLDTFLRATLPDGTSVENDDSAGANAVLRLTPSAKGTVRIEATSYEAEETGVYAVSVVTLRPPVTIRTGVPVEGDLSDTDEMIAGQPSDSYLLSGEAGSRVIIHLSATEFDPVLRAQDTNGNLQESDDISEDNRDSELSYTFPENGDLEIDVSGVDADGRGSYTLTVTAGTPPPAITPGSSIDGSLSEGDELSEGRLSDRYRLQGRAGETVNLWLSSNDFDAYLVLYDVHGVRSENDDLSEETTDSALTYTFDRDGAIELVATSYDVGESGSYTLTVSE